MRLSNHHQSSYPLTLPRTSCSDLCEGQMVTLATGDSKKPRDSFTMCNYGTDKLNPQQSQAFPDPWLQDFDKEQAAFLGQFTVFKIEIPVLMNSLTVAWMEDFCLSLMKAEHCRYTVKHASVIQLWNHQCVPKKLCKALKAVWFVLGLVTCQLMLKGIEFLNQWAGFHILLYSEFSLFCSTLTFHREIRRLPSVLYPREQESPTNWHWYNLQVMAAFLQARGFLRIYCVCAWLEEVPSTTGVVTGPKFTQKCVAWGREVLWPPLTVRVEFQPPPSPSPLSPGGSATYISHHDTRDDPHLLVRWQRLDGGEERANNRSGQRGVKKQN